MKTILLLVVLAFALPAAAPSALADEGPIYVCGSLADMTYPACCPPEYRPPLRCLPDSP